MFLVVPQEREFEHCVPSDTSNGKLSQNASHLHSSTKWSEGQNEGDDEDQVTVTERKCWCPGYDLAPINVYQLQRGTGSAQQLGPLAFSLTSRWRLQRHSDPSKPPWASSQPFTRITMFVHSPTLPSSPSL